MGRPSDITICVVVAVGGGVVIIDTVFLSGPELAEQLGAAH